MQTTSSLGEVQQIEVNRRRDVALGVLPQAARLFEQRKELTEQAAEAKRSLSSKWYWVVGLSGLAAHFVWTADARFSFGVMVAVLSYAHWMMRAYEVRALEQRHHQCTLRLGDLETIWAGATGYRTFWELEPLVGFGNIDITEESFQIFWGKQMNWIREGVQA